MLKAVLAFVSCAAALVSASASAAEPQWTAAETEHFIIYSKGPPERIEKLATDVETYDKLMRMATGIPADAQPVKVRIYEVDDTGAIQKALGIDPSVGVGGFYDSNSLGPFLVTPRKTGFEGYDFGPELVRHHEYAHHFMLQYFPSSYPAWYTEGFAELVGASEVLDDGRIGYGMPAKHRGHDIAAYWAPLQEVLAKDKVWAVDTYGQGWALTHFFTFDKSRSAQFREYLQALRVGKTLEEASRVFGDLSSLNREARLYVVNSRFDYKPVKVEIARPVIQRTRPVSAGEAALIPEVIAFRDDPLDSYKKAGARERERKLREANLERIREKAQLYPRDRFVLTFLAEAEYAAGNYPQAEAAADRLLALDPNDARGLARKAILQARRASTLDSAARASALADARKMAVRANKANPDEALPYIAFYETFRFSGEKPTAAALLGLKEAMTMQPLSVVPRDLFIDALANNGLYDQAIAWLLPIANSAHDSPRRDAAREKLAKLKAARDAQRKTAAVSTKG